MRDRLGGGDRVGRVFRGQVDDEGIAMKRKCITCRVRDVGEGGRREAGGERREVRAVHVRGLSWEYVFVK